jgi:hypothetical protein
MTTRHLLPLILASGAFALGSAHTLRAAEFHVSPQGDDSADGSTAKPFATLARAIEAARRAPAAPPHRVVLQGGSYFNTSVTLGPEHSGIAIEAAPGEKPVLYGGQPLGGWESDGDRFFSAPLPEFPSNRAAEPGPDALRGWEVRMLLVDGRMAKRARHPAEGSLTHENSFDVSWMSSTGGGWQRPPTDTELTTMRYRDGDLGAWLVSANAEVTVFHMWDESLVGVATNDVARHTLTFTTPAGHPPGAFGVKHYVLWNIREGLTQPGQWFHDRARNRIVYWPLPGQDLKQVEVIVPTTTSVLRLRGRRDARVRDVTVRGLGVSVTTVPLVAGGFAAARFDGAIDLQFADNCAFVDLTIARVGGQGINTRDRGDTGTRVENCEVAECGAGGIYVGGTRADIVNNHVHHVGVSYPSAVGIYRGGTDNRVRHNEVHDCPYSAINYGGRRNLIESNLLYRCMQVLHDGAGIYLFAADTCVLRGNYARDIIDTGGYGASAYYLDERSTNCLVEKNVSTGVGWPSHNHMATNNVLRNNLFLVNGDAKLTFPRSTGYALERNVIYATGRIVIEGANAVTRWSKNLFYSGTGRIEQLQLDRYSRHGVTNAPPGDTLTVDPLLEDWTSGEFGFRPGSPVEQIGFESIDPRRAGRIRPASHSN